MHFYFFIFMLPYLLIKKFRIFFPLRILKSQQFQWLKMIGHNSYLALFTNGNSEWEKKCLHHIYSFIVIYKNSYFAFIVNVEFITFRDVINVYIINEYKRTHYILMYYEHSFIHFCC